MIRGLLVHAFTASGAAFAFLALAAAIDRDFAGMFAWLGVAFAIDAVDGSLARRFEIDRTVPFIDGAVIDLVVDFLTYVVTPAFALWRGGVLPSALALPLSLTVCAVSAIYFGDRRMKTSDNWFRGFPALWNVVALYIFVFKPTPAFAAFAVAALIPAMFAPFVFVHPMRVRRLRVATIAVTMVWGAAATAAIAMNLDPGPVVKTALALCSIYLVFLPLLRRPPPTFNDNPTR